MDRQCKKKQQQQNMIKYMGFLHLRVDAPVHLHSPTQHQDV